MVESGLLEQMHTLLGAAIAHPGPEFGSTAWFDLAVEDPRRTAALLRSAFAWWAAAEGLGAPASQERLDALVDAEVSRELKAAALSVCGAANWETVARDTRYARAARRRREEALRPRPGNDRGGRLPAWGPSAGQGHVA